MRYPLRALGPRNSSRSYPVKSTYVYVSRGILGEQRDDDNAHVGTIPLLRASTTTKLIRDPGDSQQRQQLTAATCLPTRLVLALVHGAHSWLVGRIDNTTAL